MQSTTCVRTLSVLPGANGPRILEEGVWHMHNNKVRFALVVFMEGWKALPPTWALAPPPGMRPQYIAQGLQQPSRETASSESLPPMIAAAPVATVAFVSPSLPPQTQSATQPPAAAPIFTPSTAPLGSGRQRKPKR